MAVISVTASTITEFLNRFGNFYDAVIIYIRLDLKQGANKYFATIIVSTIDLTDENREIQTENGWVDVHILLAQVKNFRITETEKTGFQIMNMGLGIFVANEHFTLNFDTASLDDPTDLQKSELYFICESCTYEVHKYTERYY